MRFSPLLLTIVLAAPAAYGEVYRYTDENGNVVFTDESRAGAERIEVREVPTVNLPAGPLNEEVLEEAAEEPESEQENGYQEIGFSEPENDSAFWSGSGNVALHVYAQPQLQQGHQYEVLLDGQSLGQNQSGVFNVQHIDRGTHTATVRILNSQNGVTETGQSITFTVHRPSVNN